MNIRDLQYIVAIADIGHFGRAAEACNVSQPTLSGQVAKLESELGVQVFERIGRKVQPTQAGLEIVGHARRVLAAVRDISDAARAHRDPLAGQLRLGVIPTLGPYLMPYVLPRAALALPGAPLMLVEDLTANLIPLVSQGKLDGALIATAVDDPHIKTLDLFDEPFWLAAPANHHLAASKSICAEEIDPKSLLLLADGHCLRDQALELCRNPNIGENVMADMRATSLETLLHLTAAGYGVTLAPELAVACGRTSGDQFVIRPLRGPGAARRIRLIYRAGSPRAKALIELARTIRHALPASLRRTGTQDSASQDCQPA